MVEHTLLPYQTVFFISDHTAITAEKFGRSLLAQFPDQSFAQFRRLAFVTTHEQAHSARLEIDHVWQTTGSKPLVFSTLTHPALREIIAAAPCVHTDLFEMLLPLLEAQLGPASATVGQTHGSNRRQTQGARIAAMHFALANDDGANVSQYGTAEIILLGVSRCGKTPTALYLALEYGLKCANYPLTAEQLQRDTLPRGLLAHRHKLFGLSIDALHLVKRRKERWPDSAYATPACCRREVAAACQLFTNAQIPYLDTTTVSIEELATRIAQYFGFLAQLPP